MRATACRTFKMTNKRCVTEKVKMCICTIVFVCVSYTALPRQKEVMTIFFFQNPLFDINVF